MDQRSPALDGLRGLAIILVLLWHYVINHADLLMPTAGGAYVLYSLGQFAFSGVDLFFVLSGFLITGILLDNLSSPNFLKVFYLRRACRILPLYYGWLILFLVISRSFAPTPFLRSSFPDAPVWPHFLFLQNLAGDVNASLNARALAVTWSLAVEEQFYFVMPFLVLFLSRRLLAVVMVAVLLASPFIRASQTGILVNVGNFTRLDGLAWGVLLALAIRTPVLWASLRARRRIFLGLWLGLTAVMITGPLFSPPLYSLNAAAWALLLFLTVSEPPGVFQRFLAQKILIFSGRISYGLYLFHYVMMGAAMAFVVRFFHYGGSYNFWIAGAGLLATYLLAYAVFHLVEKPIIAWGHKFKYRREKPAPSLPSPFIGIETKT